MRRTSTSPCPAILLELEDMWMSGWLGCGSPRTRAEVIEADECPDRISKPSADTVEP